MRRSAIIALALILTACDTPEAATAPPDPTSSEVVAPGSTEGPGTLRVGLGRDPRSIDPRSVVDAEGELIARALFEPLVDVAPDGSLQPASAERWEIEDEGRTYRFHLRSSTFHDGRPLTAHDHARALLGVFDLTRPPYFREELLAGLLGARGAPASERDGEASGEDEERSTGTDVADPPPDAAVPPVPEEGVLRRVWGTPQDIDTAGGVEVVNDRELIVRLREPDPRFLASLTDVALMPVPYSALGDAAAFAEKPVGNGPFRMLEPRERGTFIRLVAVEDHHRQPSLEGIVFQIVADDADRSIRLEELLAGRLHVAAVPAAQRRLAGREFGLASPDGRGSGLHAATTASVYAYAFDVSAAPFDDALLRRAIAAAIDRERIAAVVLAGAADAATTLLPPSLVGVQPVCGHCQHDADLARTLFAQWRDGRADPTASPRLSLTYPRDGGHVAIAESIARDVEATLDVRVFLQARDLGGFGRDVASGEAPLFRLGLVAPLAGDAAMSGMLDPTFRSDAGDDRNWTRWGDAASDALLDQLRPGLGDEAAEASATALANRLVEEAVVVPLLWTRHDLVVRPEVRGFALDTTGRWWPELVSLD